MNISLNPQKTLKAFQAEFHSLFPCLQLKFFRHGHLPGQGSVSYDQLDGNLSFSQAGNLDHTEAFEISGAMTVKEFEMLFQEHFNIGAQVMRKSGNAWIMTTRTDDWTLRHSNEEGREDSQS